MGKKYRLTFSLYDGSEKAVVFEVPEGEVGPVGPQGIPGVTPVKGIDYFTEEDKAEMVADVLASLPAWNGGSY